MQFFPFQAIISLNYSTSVGQFVSSASEPGYSGKMAPGVRESNVARLTFGPLLAPWEGSSILPRRLCVQEYKSLLARSKTGPTESEVQGRSEPHRGAS